MSERDDAAYIDHLETKVKELEQEVARLRKEKGLSSAGDGLTFDQKTGTNVDGTKKHFCTVCLDQDKRRELRVEPHGYRCMICKKYYPDPDRPEGGAEILDMGGGGPQGWMR